jgi:hypothetical protein
MMLRKGYVAYVDYQMVCLLSGSARFLKRQVPSSVNTRSSNRKAQLRDHGGGPTP